MVRPCKELNMGNFLDDFLLFDDFKFSGFLVVFDINTDRLYFPDKNALLL